MVINLLNLFFPKVCLGCEAFLTDNERYLCTACRHGLPTTNFASDVGNDTGKRLYGRVNYQYATSLLWFHKKGIVQHLMHQLKYKGHQEVGVFLGQWMGELLSDKAHFEAIDVVVPVPLHKSRLLQRGYNQVDKFGKEIAKALNIEYQPNVLIKTEATKTQVFKNRLKRIMTDETNFSVSEKQSLENKHILLVDDIITTGATLEACSNALLSIKGIKISIATMAIAE